MRRARSVLGVAGCVAALLSGAAGAGCSTSPGISNGSVSVCYRAIPIGRQAVGEGSATLIGVHRIAVDQVRSRLPVATRNELAAENDSAVCAMAFRGHFAAGQVTGAPSAQSGQYALVLVSSRRLHLVAAVVLDRLPRAFGGRTL